MKTKKEYRYFSITDYVKEQEYLQQRHREGWKFVKVTGCGIYHFEECQPEEVVYQLDYNQESAAHKEEYIKMFADCGWEHLQEFAGYSYFRKKAAEMDGDEEIFCDDASRLAMMERVYKGRILPLVSIFFSLIGLFTIHLCLGNYGVATFLGICGAIYLVLLLFFGISFLRFKANLKT